MHPKDSGQLTGRVAGSRLTCVRFSHRDKNGSRINLYKCKCGNYKKLYQQAVNSLNTKSCGCLKKELNRHVYKRMRKREKKRR